MPAMTAADGVEFVYDTWGEPSPDPPVIVHAASSPTATSTGCRPVSSGR